MNKIDNIYTKSTDIRDFSKKYSEYLSEIFNKIKLEQIEKFVDILLNAREKDQLFFS